MHYMAVNGADIDVDINIITGGLYAMISARNDKSLTRGRAALFQGWFTQDSDLDVSC